MSDSSTRARLVHHEVSPTRRVPGVIDDARDGLLQPPRVLPPKYFYDDHGSQLFEAICAAPEYYPTRTEDALLAEASTAIIERVAPDHLIELGSGSSTKTRHLIAACDAAGVTPRYWPFEVSSQIMLDAADSLMRDYPWLSVDAMTGDYTGGLANLPLAEDGGRRLFLFLGGTLGNFEPEAAAAMLDEIGALMNPGDALLLCLDRVKDRHTLEAAYDDAAGHTAAFNRNVINVLNRELGGDMPETAYQHRAVFNEHAERIEMWLVAKHDHEVYFDALEAGFSMRAGEGIMTEISRKFTELAIGELLAQADLAVMSHFEAPEQAYSLILATRA